MKMRFGEEQIIGFLKEAEGGVPVKELCRKDGFSDASFYLWRSKYGGMEVSDAKRLKSPESENARLKPLAEPMLENEVELPLSDRTGCGLLKAAEYLTIVLPLLRLAGGGTGRCRGMREQIT